MKTKRDSEKQTARRTTDRVLSGNDLSRRAFLGKGTLCLAAAGFAASASCTAPEPEPSETVAGLVKPKVVVGAHVWVYAAKMPGYDVTPILPEIFADMKAAGIAGVELMHNVLMHDGCVERIRSISDEHGLPVNGTSFEGAMWDREAHSKIIDDVGLVVSRLAALGGTTFGASVGDAHGTKTPEQLDAQAEILPKLISLCEASGVTLNLHNHTYEVVDGMHDLRGTLARLPNVPLGPDLNWLIRGGVDPVAFIQEFGSQIVFLHLRDQNRDGTWSEALGEGSTDFEAIAKALHAANFAGDANIELAHESDFTPTRPLRDSLRMSREFVREVLGY